MQHMFQLKRRHFQPCPRILTSGNTLEFFYILKKVGHECDLVPVEEQLSFSVSSQNTEFPIMH